MGKTRDLFKKIRDTKGTFHANMGTKKDINCKDLTEASGPITSWEIDGETVETVSDFIFLGSKITANGDCSHEIKRCLLLGRKVMTNLDQIRSDQISRSVVSSSLRPHELKHSRPPCPSPTPGVH